MPKKEADFNLWHPRVYILHKGELLRLQDGEAHDCRTSEGYFCLSTNDIIEIYRRCEVK